MFTLFFLFLSLNIFMTKCDATCDCKEINSLKEMVMNEISVLQETIQREIFDQKKESTRLHSKIRRIELLQRSEPVSTEASDSGLADRLRKIETKLADTDVSLNFLLSKRSEALRNAINFINKGLASEKQERKEFTSHIESEITNIKGTVANFKEETIKSVQEYRAHATASCANTGHDIESTCNDIGIDLKSMKEDLMNAGEDLKNEQKIVSRKLSKLKKKVVDIDKIDGGWTDWGAWSSCSVTCGGGIRERTRTCSNPLPSQLGKQCEGNSVNTGACGRVACRDCASRLYMGKRNSAKSGRECQHWSSQSPHEHVYSFSSLFPEDQNITAARNYCRDPSSSGYLWCFTTDQKVRWEECGC